MLLTIIAPSKVSVLVSNGDQCYCRYRTLKSVRTVTSIMYTVSIVPDKYRSLKSVRNFN